jgi:hypothetical protein
MSALVITQIIYQDNTELGATFHWEFNLGRGSLSADMIRQLLEDASNV